MSLNIAPPASLEEFPTKFLQLFEALGANLEKTREELPSYWQQNSTLYRSRSELSSMVADTVVIDQVPDWRQPLHALAKQANDAGKDRIFFDLLSYILPADELVSLPLAVEVAEGERLTHWIVANHLPRNDAERAAMIERLPTIESVRLQRRVLLRLKSNDSDHNANLLRAVMDGLHSNFFRMDDEGNRRYAGEFASQLLRHISDPELLEQIARRGSDDVVRRVLVFYGYGKPKPDWTPVMDLVAQQPTALLDESAFGMTVEVLRLVWDSCAETHINYQKRAINRAVELLNSTCEGVNPHDTPEQCRDLLYMMLDSGVSSGFPSDLRDAQPKALKLLWESPHPQLEDCLLATCASRYDRYSNERKSLAKMLSELMIKHSGQYLSFYPEQFEKTLPLINNEQMLRTVGEALKPKAATSKVIQRGLIKGLAKIDPDMLDTHGWINDRKKGIRLVGMEALLARRKLDTVPLLRKIFDDKRTNDADRDRIVKHIKSVGGDVGGLVVSAELSDSGRKKQASKTRIKAAVKRVWSPELAALFAPIAEDEALWLLNLVHDSKAKGLPKTATDALKQLPANQQSDLAAHLTQLWLANGGDAKHRWLMRFVPKYADDRVVAPLSSAFQQWNKRARPKAIFALQTLGDLNTQLALSFIYEVHSKSNYAWSIDELAEKLLKTAARKRKVSLRDLGDELTPDFGVGPDGIALDVGPYQYRVRIASDLSLRVENSSTGRVTKSLPKAKADEDNNLRASAETRFKLLRGNLRKIAKQQAKRLQEAMICERFWPARRWQEIYLKHPLLVVLASGLIWRKKDGGSFRISEDGSLIGVDDDKVYLKQKDSVALWHPVNVDAAEVEHWRQHLADYELKPLFDQVNQPRLKFTSEELLSGQVERFSNVELAQTTVRHRLQSWNYAICSDDGPNVFSMERDFGLIGLSVEVFVQIDLTGLPGDTTPLGGIAFSKHGGGPALELKTIPAPLAATVLGLLSELIQTAGQS